MSVGWLKDAAVIDFESLPIRDRPRHPPIPVGVALRVEGRSRYLAFGHPDGNTSTWEDARRELGKVYESGRPLLFHGAKFDVEVAEVHMEMPRLSWGRYHDTLPALFLSDPRAENFKLKDAAERLLGHKPDERDALVDWLVEHQPVPGKKLSKSPNSDNYAGAYVAYCPPSLTGPYAVGDVDRTFDIAKVLFKEIEARGMTEPYDRERQLLLYLMEMEQQGVRVHLDKLRTDVGRYTNELVKLEDWLRKKLRASSELNLDSGPQLADALIKAGIARKEDFGVTPKTGKMQTNKEALTAAVHDPQILAVLTYRAQLGTCLKTFMRPWLETAEESRGFIYTEWHSTRRDRGEGGVGARTGRFSSTPNFGNIPNEFSPLFTGPLDKDKTLPKAPYNLQALPTVRSYIAPYADGDVLIDRDYSQQEPRILAHYEDGHLCKTYNDDPWVDYHDTAKAKLLEYGLDLPRKKVKIINLALIYGMGLGLMSEKTGLSVEEVKKVKAGILAAYPGLRDIYDSMKERAKAGQPIRTWGGREYFCEEPKFDPKRKRWMEYDYKLPNVLIQGSAADCTKQAMLNFEARRKPGWRLLLTVHDELLVSVPRRDRDRAMEVLRECMESVDFDVPMLSEGEWSGVSWEDLEPYDKKGKKVVNARAVA